MLYTLLTTVFIVDALFLIILIILLQQGPEGGMGGLGGGNTGGVIGASGGARFIVRLTWFFGILFFILGLSIAWLQTHNQNSFGQSVEDALMDTPVAPAPLSSAATAPLEVPTAAGGAQKLPVPVPKGSK